MENRGPIQSAPPRASVLGAGMLGLVATISLGLTARAALHLDAVYPWKAAAVFAAVMCAAGFMREPHLFRRFGPANQMTTARAVLVALVAGLIGEPARPAVAMGAVGAALIVTALDGVDGWLARRSRMASAFGARFDMEIDALLVMVLAVLSWRHGKAGVWVLVSGLLRYGFVAAGWLWRWMRQPLPPSRRRQTICVVQVAGLMLTLAPAIRPPQSVVLAAVALAALCASFLIDVVWLWRATPVTPTSARAPAFR